MMNFIAISVYRKKGNKVSLVFRKNKVLYRITSVGNLVSYQILDKNVVRMVVMITKPPSIKQLICRQQMAVAVKFLYPFTEFINAGFMLKARAAVKYPYNIALSYNKMNDLKVLYRDV